MIDNNLFSASLSSIRLDGLRFKLSRLIKYDNYSYNMYSIVYFSDCTFFCLKNKQKSKHFGDGTDYLFSC